LLTKCSIDLAPTNLHVVELLRLNSSSPRHDGADENSGKGEHRGVLEGYVPEQLGEAENGKYTAMEMMESGASNVRSPRKKLKQRTGSLASPWKMAVNSLVLIDLFDKALHIAQ
jgi:hypothetical protein